MKSIIFHSFLGILLFLFSNCSKEESYVKTEGIIWNTSFHITYKGPKSLQDSILPVLNEVSRSLSVFDKNSLITALNNSNQIEMDKHLAVVYDMSRKIHTASHGKFDPTVSPLVDAWGFGRGHKASSDTLRIDSLLDFVGIDKTRIEGDFLIKEDPRIQFNFSAIAKGYGCDAVGEMFIRNGVKDFMVEIGGELALSGESPAGKEWFVAIDAPIENLNPGDETVMIIGVTDAGIATSGNYRNYRMEGDKKVAHTISPQTGRPYIGEILSVTVIAPSCMEADAIATACMAGSVEEAQSLLKECDTHGLLILADSVLMTYGFQRYLINEVSVPERTSRN